MVLQQKAPTPPAHIQIKASNKALTILWHRSSGENIKGYYLFKTDVRRKERDTRGMTLLKNKDAVYTITVDETDGLWFSYKDSKVVPGVRYYYTVVAVIEGGYGRIWSKSSRVVSAGYV